MMPIALRARGMTFINAGSQGARAGIESLRMVGSRIVAVNGAAAADDLVIDLRGDRLLPGLINAHDHLQLNTLPPLESAKRYAHVREWIQDVDLRRRNDAAFEELVARPRNDRLLIGGIKNLLSGVTTVAHHDPFYPFLSDACFPTRVVMDCGWSHSLYLDGDEEVRDSCRRTPPDRPWIIHAAEGTDREAAGEFDRLEELGCLRSNTLIVHGVSLDPARRLRLERASAGLIWCPSSNLRLFGCTAEVDGLAQRGQVALGTDSRLSGSRDLLEELGVAREAAHLDEVTLESMVTTHSAALLRLADRGALQVGALADLVVLPAGRLLSQISRGDIRLVVLGGLPRYADEAYARIMPPTFWSQVRVDGRPKVLEASLAAALCAAQSAEPGLEISAMTWRAA
jgi:cytosine/adenosine deaminase-related metal-dependent hydrolase